MRALRQQLWQTLNGNGLINEKLGAGVVHVGSAVEAEGKYVVLNVGPSGPANYDTDGDYCVEARLATVQVFCEADEGGADLAAEALEEIEKVLTALSGTTLPNNDKILGVHKENDDLFIDPDTSAEGEEIWQAALGMSFEVERKL